MSIFSKVTAVSKNITTFNNVIHLNLEVRAVKYSHTDVCGRARIHNNNIAYVRIIRKQIITYIK